MNKNILAIILFSGLLFSCVERGKPIKKEKANETTKVTTQPTVEHYTCPNGHKGSDKQGICAECKVAFVHNQAFHPANVAIPQPTLKDPFSNAPVTPNTPSPAQNAYGDYHYTCPNGHPGGSGSAGNCTSCEATLVHNQLYHK